MKKDDTKTYDTELFLLLQKLTGTPEDNMLALITDTQRQFDIMVSYLKGTTTVALARQYNLDPVTIRSEITKVKRKFRGRLNDMERFYKNAAEKGWLQNPLNTMEFAIQMQHQVKLLTEEKNRLALILENLKQFIPESVWTATETKATAVVKTPLVSLEDFGLLKHWVATLKAVGIEDLATLATKTKAELLSYPKIDRKKVAVLEELLEREGLGFGMNVEDAIARICTPRTLERRE